MIHVVSPSLGRSKTATSHKLFPVHAFSYVVNEDEVAAYRRDTDARVQGIPMGLTKNIAETRNWILGQFKPGDWVIMVDDDLKAVNQLYNREQIPMSPPEIMKFSEEMYQLATELNTGIWGMNVLIDPKAYQLNNPLSFKNPVLGPFSAHIVDELRYESELTLKDDYDFWLQKVNKYGLSLRANYVNYQCDHQKLAGGCQKLQNLGSGKMNKRHSSEINGDLRQ